MARRRIRVTPQDHCNVDGETAIGFKHIAIIFSIVGLRYTMSRKTKRVILATCTLVNVESCLFGAFHKYNGFSLVWPFPPSRAIVAGPVVTNTMADQVRARCEAAYASLRTYRGTSHEWSDWAHVPGSGSSTVTMSRPGNLKVVCGDGFVAHLVRTRWGLERES